VRDPPSALLTLKSPMAERFLIMNDQWKIRSQIFCLGFATIIEGDFNRPFFSFIAFENPGFFADK
jgi:hypothetical protein